MQQQYLVCNLPKKLGGLSVQELKDLLHESGIVRNKSNNFLKTKKDMCLALTLKNSDAFLEALRVNINEYNPSLRDFSKIASAHARRSKQSADKLQKDKNKVRDLHHDLLSDNYHFPSRGSEDLHMAGLQNRYESEKNELQAMYDRLQQKETEIRSMQNNLEDQKRHFLQPSEESGLAAVKMDVMQLKMQEKYLMNAIDEIRLHVNRLKSEERSNSGQSDEIQSRILQLLGLKKELEQSAYLNTGKLETVKTGLSPADHAEYAKIDEAANTLTGENSLVEDAEKIHREVEEKQQDIEQLRVNLTAVRARLQQYVDVFPRIEDAIAFATTSTDLQDRAKRLQNIIRAADTVSKRVHDKIEKLYDSSLRTQQQDPDDVVSLLENVDLILDKFDEVSGDVSRVDVNLEKAQSELRDLRETFVSLAQRVDRNIDAAKLDDHELANILKNFIINRSYLKTAITDLHHEHGIAHSRTASVKSKLAEISDSLGRLEGNQAVVGGGGEDDEDILNVLSNIELRIKKIAQKQSDDRQTYLNTLKKYKDSLAKKEDELKTHLSEAIDQRTQDIRADVEDIEQEINNNNQTLQKFIKELEDSKMDDKAKFSSLSKKAFELMEEQSVLFHGLKVKLNAVNFAETLKSFAEIEEGPIVHDETIFNDAAKKYDEELESITTLKAELKDALDEHSRLNRELSAVEFEIKKSEVRADHDRLLEELTEKRKRIELEISENEKELKEYEEEVLTHEQNISQINSGIDADVFSALENAYQAQMASKSERLERVNEELEEMAEDDSDESLEAHQRQLHRDATMKLQDVIQKLKEEISNIKDESGELDQLRAHKVNLLEREKELTQKYLGTLEGRDSDLVSLAEQSKQLHDHHMVGLDPNFDGQTKDNVYNAKISQMIELEQQTKERYESLQNECRERLNSISQEKASLLEEVQAVAKRAEAVEREKQSEIQSIGGELEAVQIKMAEAQEKYNKLYAVASDINNNLQTTLKKLKDLEIKTDPERVQKMEERLHAVETENNRNMMLKTANKYLQEEIEELRREQNKLQTKVLKDESLTAKIHMLQETLKTQTSDLTEQRIEFERKSAEKAHLDKRLEDIRATIKDLMGKKLYRFDDPRSIANEPVEAIKDIADDYDFFRNAYQDTAKDLRNNIVELVKTLNQGNTTIDYDTIQSRVDALKYLSEDQQKERLKQTRELIADDYESLVKKGKEEARLLAKTYEAETDWRQVEAKINKLLNPVGSIEHSRDSLKLINDFFRITKSSMKKLEEEKQDVDIKDLHDNMIAYFEAAQALDNAARSNDLKKFLDEVKQLYKTSQKINFNTLESAMYLMDERNSTVLKSFLTVFKLRSDDLLLGIVRKFKRKLPTDKTTQRFNRIEDLPDGLGVDSVIAPSRLTELNSNFKSRLELMSQVFPKIELMLLKIPDAPIDEEIYFDTNRFASSMGTKSMATQLSTNYSKIDCGKYLYAEFLKELENQEPQWLTGVIAGQKQFDEDLFKAMISLKKFNVVQKKLHENNCIDINKQEIKRFYETYGQYSETHLGFDVFIFKENSSLSKYFKDIQDFLNKLENQNSNNRRFGGFLSDMRDMMDHLDLKRDVLRTALIDRENKLNKIEMRGGRVVDANTIIPYDIRKLNAVLTRINDMVAANLKDLQKAKAAGFENAQYETKLKKIENDLLEKENLLTQFDGITKQSIERALLLEQELVRQNTKFEGFCLFLMGRRQDPDLNTVLFDASKNVFGFMKDDGKPIFDELDWHKKLPLAKEERWFRSFADINSIKSLLKKQLKKLSYESFEEVLESLVSCHSYLQNSDSFHEEDLILREIISLRKILDKVKTDEYEIKMTLEARFEDLKDLNDDWGEQMLEEDRKKMLQSRHFALLVDSVGDNMGDKSNINAFYYASRILDFMKSKKGNIPQIEEAENRIIDLNNNKFFFKEDDLLALKNEIKKIFPKDPTEPIEIQIAQILLGWSFRLNSIFLTPSNPTSLEYINFIEERTQLKEFYTDTKNILNVLKQTKNTDLIRKAIELLTTLGEIGSLISIALSLKEPKEEDILEANQKALMDLKPKFKIRVKAIVETFLATFSGFSHSGGGIVKDSAKQFVNQSDEFLKLIKDKLLPSKRAISTSSEVPEEFSPLTYENFITTVLSTTGRENIEEMLGKLTRLTSKIREEPPENDNDLQLSTLLRVAHKLLQERLDCQNRQEELSKTLSEQLYEAEKSFKRQVENCNDRIHSANQKVLQAEHDNSSRGSKMTKGDGIAYGYLITSANAFSDDNRFISVSEISTGVSPSRKSSIPPPYDFHPEEQAKAGTNVPAIFRDTQSKDTPIDRIDLDATKAQLPSDVILTSDLPQIWENDLNDPRENEIKTDQIDASPSVIGQESSTVTASADPEISSIDPWKNTEKLNISSDTSFNEDSEDPWVEIEHNPTAVPVAIENPEERSDEMLPNKARVNESSNTNPLDSSLALGSDSTAFPFEEGEADIVPDETADSNGSVSFKTADEYNIAPHSDPIDTKTDLPSSPESRPNIDGWNEGDATLPAPNTRVTPASSVRLEATTNPELSYVPPDVTTKVPEHVGFQDVTDQWESLATDKSKRAPDTELRFKPRQRQTTAGDAAFSPADPQDLQKAFRSLYHNDFDEKQAWNDDVITGGAADDSPNKVMGHLLLLYIHYSRFIRKPQILRLISTVENTGGTFIGALRTSGVDEADTFYINLLRLIFVDVTDLVLPEETNNNEISDRFMAFSNANSITYRMQLQALDKGASERKVVRTDLFFRFCLDLMRSLDTEKLAASLRRVDASIGQPSSEKFTNLDLFLIQMMYQSRAKQDMVKLSNSIANQESMTSMNLSHTRAGTSAVLTYVKIRCDQDEIWNERYRLGVLRNEAAKMEMLVEFNTHVFPYYSHNKENALRSFQLVSDEARRFLPVASRKNWAIGDNVPYQYHMLFGPFTKVFGPDKPVQEIAKECEGIKTTIISGKSILIMGYGSSGSGKTSTLVCQSGKGACSEPGILPNILEDSSITSRYRDVELSICELFAGQPSPAGEVHWKTQNMRFQFDGSGFIFKSTSKTNDEYTPLSEHSERAEDPVRFRLSIDEKTRIDTVIRHCIEVDRRSRGTTNNPNSSRSHVFVFVHFKDGPYLILGDFAGVENEFVCNNIETLLAIYNSQKCNDLGSCTRVYTPAVAESDLSQFQRGQCGAGTDIAQSKNENFTLHGDDKRVPDVSEETKIVSDVLTSRGRQGSLFSQLEWNVQDPKKFKKSQLESLLTALRTTSDWVEEKTTVKRELFDRPESVIYLELAQTNQISIAKLFSESTRKRIEFTISFIAAASAAKDTSIWGAQVLRAIDAFVGTAKERSINYKPVEYARRELKTMLQDRRDCFVDLFGFDADEFEQSIRAEKSPAAELASQMQSLARKFAKLFEVIAVAKPQNKKDEDGLKKTLWDRVLRMEQFLTAIIVAHVDAFDSSFQMVKRMIVICKCRTYEGRYINNSLEQVRNIVKDIIQQQQREKGKLRTTPAFADACLPIYCNPFKEECLESEDVRSRSGKEISLAKSLLMNTISTKIGDSEFRDMKIAVFTVFLMNRTVNNDPPVPFIYAEDLRSEYIRLRNFDSTQELAGEIQKYLTGATRANMLAEIDRYGSDLTTDIKPEVMSDLRVQISKQRERLGDNIANGLESQLSNASANSLNTIKNLLRAIDGINAVHPVGTLQVTDAIAKFNMSDLYCSFSHTSSPFVAQLREKLEGNNCFVNLMSKNRLTLLPPSDPADIKSMSGGGIMFDPKTMDEFLHQWLVTTGSSFTDYLYKLSDRVENSARQKPAKRKSTDKKSEKRVSNKRKNLKRKASRSSIKMPTRSTRKFF